LTRLFRISEVADGTRIGFTGGALGAFKQALVRLGVIDRPETLAAAAAVDRGRSGADRGTPG
jgi:hypothetical protein